MKITVLNGSPKGDLSVTLQYVNFIQKKFPQHTLQVFNISHQIKKIEKDQAFFQEIISAIELSDGILWSFPLYVFLVPSQYKKFIELIFERGLKTVFQHKYTAVLTTSIHFFDHAAHNYVHAICDDLEMKYVGSFSADMYDLLQEENREKLILFAQDFFNSIEKAVITTKNFKPLTTVTKLDYLPAPVEKQFNSNGKKIIVLTDIQNQHSNLQRMIERLKNLFVDEIEVVNLYDLDIKGGCLGCLRCGCDNICAYQDLDEFVTFYNTKLKAADIIIFAGTIKDRYLSWKWKEFFDRGFFNTHTPSLIGKQIGFLISGPLSQIPNLQQILEAYTEWQQANLVDIITDEYPDSVTLDKLLENFATRLVEFSEKNYIKPATFLGIAGMKIFRDDMWGRLRFPFLADHRFYQNHGVYNFPQKDYPTRIKNAIFELLTKIPSIRKEIYTKKIKTGMLEPLQKVVNSEV